MAGTRAVFLDRDGTINEDVGYTHRPEDLRLLPGAAEGLRRLYRMGFRLVIVSNQSGVARGYFSEADVERFNEALVQTLVEQYVLIEAIYFCPTHPTAALEAYRRDSDDRKPGTGMLRRAATELGLDLAASYVIGDKRSDILAGQAAGCRTILVLTGDAGRTEPQLDARPDAIVPDLVEAARQIEAWEQAP